MAKSVARARTIRMAPRKMRLVADLIRGRKVAEARDILRFTKKASAPLIGKVLESAVANAESAAAERRERLDTDEMVVSHVVINPGPTLRRFRPAPRGRAMRIRKRTSHIEMVISNE